MRWILKKLTRRALVIGARLSAPLRRSRRGPHVRVLTYHRFGDVPRDPFCVRESEFDAQMAWLSRRGLAVSLEDLEGFLAGRKPLAPGSVLVTVDDGCPCLYSCALPIAKRHGIPLVAFVPAGEVLTGNRDGHPPSDDPHARITHDELLALAANGIAIGSHAHTHRSLGKLDPAEARREATESRATLERVIGRPVTAFAYPYGTRADYNLTTTDILRDVGYRLAFTSQHGAIAPGADPLTLPRVKIEGGEGLWMFRAIVGGGLDAWRWVDRFMWRLQEAR